MYSPSLGSTLPQREDFLTVQLGEEEADLAESLSDLIHLPIISIWFSVQEAPLLFALFFEYPSRMISRSYESLASKKKPELVCATESAENQILR